MFKVICINNDIKYTLLDVESLKKLKIGNIYTVINIPHPDGYELEEVKTSNPSGFLAERFIRLSNIDETELIKERELVNQ